MTTPALLGGPPQGQVWSPSPQPPSTTLVRVPATGEAVQVQAGTVLVIRHLSGPAVWLGGGGTSRTSGLRVDPGAVLVLPVPTREPVSFVGEPPIDLLAQDGGSRGFVPPPWAITATLLQVTSL